MRWWTAPRAFMGIVAVAMLAAACGGGAEPTASPRPAASVTPTAAAPTPAPSPTAPPAPTATARPTPQGQLRVGLGVVDFGLFPEKTQQRVFQDPLYDNVIGAAPDGKLDQSGLANAWEANANFTAWTVRLRKGVTFHNGDVATASDVKWMMEFQSRPGSVLVGADYIRDKVQAIETPDDATLVVRLKEPNFLFAAEYLSPLGSSTMNYVVPQKYTLATGADAFNKSPVGTGPFKFKEIKLGDRIVFEALDQHWYQGVPRYKTVEIDQMPEEQTRVASLKSGRLEVAEVARSNGSALRKENFNVYVKEGSGVASVFIHEQHQNYPGGNPLANVKVREALNISVDRNLIVEKFLNGLGTPTINYPVVSWDPAYKKLPLPEFNPARARKLLEEAGLAGFSLDVAIYRFQGMPEGPEIMEAIAAWWEQIGIKVNRRPVDYNAFRLDWFNQRLGRPTVAGVILLSNRTIATVLGAASRTASSRLYEDDELERLGNAWRAATNPDDYIRIGQQVQQRNAEQFRNVTLFETGETYAAVPRAVPSWQMGRFAYSLRLNSIAAGK